VATCNLSRVLKAERIAVGSVMAIKKDWAGRYLKAHIGGRSSHATEALQRDNLGCWGAAEQLWDAFHNCSVAPNTVQ
jgi:hypothetical protein